LGAYLIGHSVHRCCFTTVEGTGPYYEVSALEEFHSLGIHFVSLTEAIDTSTPMGRMVFTVLGAVAELERSLIVKRVKRRFETRQKKKVRLWAVPAKIVDREILRLNARGFSLRAIAGELDISKSMVHNLVSP
jgi:DNA invertase Pin-like site-specific DNA recombinase